jgi:cation diffusion facilitator CzcD-associated flavoprotein CzcO
MNKYDAVIVGGGFAGIYMLYRAKKLGLKVKLLEAGDGAGGTWHWNRYPGARCDIESMQYSYQFDDALQQEWKWSEKYASQPEILRYIDHVIERYGLACDMLLNTRVESAKYDQSSSRWTINTGQETYNSQFCIMATGCLSSTNIPNFEGKELFNGPIYHTGEWPKEGVDFTGKTVGIIGTGSSSIQAIPIIAEQAKHLTIFQRTPNFSVPAQNEPLAPEKQKDIKENYSAFRESGKAQILAYDTYQNARPGTSLTDEEILEECESRWKLGALNWYGAFPDILVDQRTNDIVGEFVREKIKRKVNNPQLAEMLMPDSVFGCKRLCADTNYYETFNRDNVTLIDLRKNPIDTFSEQGIKVGKEHYELDAIISATGFDAMTGSLNKIRIVGRDGLTLKDKWEAGPLTYLGLQSAGFPNLFIISGPGSPSVLTCMITSIEQHVDFIGDVITHMKSKKAIAIEATTEAENSWVSHVNDVAGSTLLNNCNSWYLGANVPGKPRVFMPYVGFPAYAEKCRTVVENDYEGFLFDTA